MKWVQKALEHTTPPQPMAYGVDLASGPDMSALTTLKPAEDWTPGSGDVLTYTGKGASWETATIKSFDFSEAFAELGKTMADMGATVGETLAAVKNLGAALNKAIPAAVKVDPDVKTQTVYDGFTSLLTTKLPAAPTSPKANVDAALQHLKDASLYFKNVNISQSYEHNAYPEMDVNFVLTGKPDSLMAFAHAMQEMCFPPMGSKYG